nr:unnamed protein product [Digitaria exilis]
MMIIKGPHATNVAVTHPNTDRNPNQPAPLRHHTVTTAPPAFVHLLHDLLRTSGEPGRSNQRERLVPDKPSEGPPMAKQKGSPRAAVRRRLGGAGASALGWALRVATSIVAWTLLLHLFTFLGIPRPPLPIARPSCLGGVRNSSTTADAVVAAGEAAHLAPPALPPRSECFSPSSSGDSRVLGLGFVESGPAACPVIGWVRRFSLPPVVGDRMWRL